jgi:hypothetical protein
MGFLRASKSGGQKEEETKTYYGLQIQTSSSAVAIPIVYGDTKISFNLLEYGSFAGQWKSESTGGKGGGGHKSANGSAFYTASLALGLCEGPIHSVPVVWADQAVSTPAYLALGTLLGTSYQVLPYAIETWVSRQSLNYRTIALAISSLYYLGESATIGSLNFEVFGILFASSGVNYRDADPAQIIYDFLTNQQYGVGFPAASIDTASLFGPTTTYAAYCLAAGIALSPALVNRESANSILSRWMQLTNSEMLWSGGKLKVIPYGDTAITGPLLGGASTASWTPNVTPIYDLTDDDFVGDSSEDPVLVERKDPYDITNYQELQFSNRRVTYTNGEWVAENLGTNGYNTDTVSVWDQASIDTFGLRIGSQISANEICDKDVAQRVAQLNLQRQLYVRNTYVFKLSFEFCLLEPMDIVTLTDSALGLSMTPVRIISIEEDDDGLLTVEAEEFQAGVGHAASYSVQGSEGGGIDRNRIPDAVNPPIIFEPPPGLTGGDPQIWAVISGGISPTRRLEEDGSTGSHLVSATLPSQAPGAAISFAVYVLADERTACRLQIFDGVATQSVSFNLSTGVASGATFGITSSSITPANGGPWYFLSISCQMVASSPPVPSIALEEPAGTVSYTGTVGEGLFVWGAEYAANGAAYSTIATTMTPSGATFDADAQDPPTGVEGTADPKWGGCFIHLSTDGTNYTQIGQIDGQARTGKVTGDSGSAIGVQMVESGGTLPPASSVDADNGVTLSLAGDELFAYGGATLTGSNAYDLSGLLRGLYGTTISTHSPGERFARLDDLVFKYTVPLSYIGRLLYLKFQSYNIFGLAPQDLSTCATYTFTPSGSGAALGLIMSQLALGVDIDLGFVADAVTSDEDLGPLSYVPNSTVDLGGVA